MKKYRIDQFEKTEILSKDFFDDDDTIINFIKNEYQAEDVDIETLGTYDNLSEAKEALKDMKCRVKIWSYSGAKSNNAYEVDLTLVYIEELEVNEDDEDEIEEYKLISYADFVVC